MKMIKADNGDNIIYLNGGGEPIEFEADTGGEDKLKTFSMVAYTGGILRLWSPVVIDLAGLKISGKARPILRQHDPRRIVGHTTTIDNNNKSLKVTGVVSGTGEDAREVTETGRNGFPWQASVGVYVEKMISVGEGEKVTVNGRSFTGPLYVARKTYLAEVSFVPLGADDNTSAKIAANGDIYAMNFETWLKDKGFILADLSEAQVAFLKASYEAEQNAQRSPPPPLSPPEINAGGGERLDIDAIVQRAITSATEGAVRAVTRRQRVQELCANNTELLEMATRENWDEQRTELEVLRASRSSGPAIHVRNVDHQNTSAIEAAMLLRGSGLTESAVGSLFNEETMNAAVSQDYRGFGMHELIYASVLSNGGYIRPGRIGYDEIRTAMRLDPALNHIQAASGWSTISLSGILGNVANKMLLAAYNAVNSVVELFCSTADHPDFKVISSYRMTGVGMFEQVAPTGELKHADLSEETFTNQVMTYGKMLSLTRTMMINDDLNAFLGIPRIIGRQAALKREETVFTLLLSNPSSFFSAGNNNYLDGAATALSITSLTSAEQLFLDQTDSDGKPILVTPAILLVPSALKVTAQQLMTETRVVGQGLVAAAALANNPHAGKWQPVATPYLNSQGLTGSSSLAWYLFSNPADVAAIQIAYLRGQRTPVLESAEADFNVLGMQWRGYFDWGVGMQDHRGAVKMKGEA
jgi:hypothetical protein